MQNKLRTPTTNNTDDLDTLADAFDLMQSKFDISAIAKADNLTKWINGLVWLTYQSIPAPLQISDGEFSLTQLDKTDPRGVFSGRYVGCCQHPQSWAAECVWHGHSSPEGAFWVVEHKERIIATAWVWRHEDNLVIDSVEMRESVEEDKVLENRVFALYISAAWSTIGRLGITRVYAGCGYRDNWTTENDISRPFPSPQTYEYKSSESGKITIIDDSELVHLVACDWQPES